MSSINLANPDVFANGAPWSLFEELRKNQPIHWSEEEKPNSGFYSVTRFHDIVKVLRDAETFTSERFTNLEEVDAEQEEARRSLLETDGTRHRALRRLLQGQFFVFDAVVFHLLGQQIFDGDVDLFVLGVA